MSQTAQDERLTERELAVWRELLDTTSELRRLLSAELQQVELSPGDYAVLLALTEADGNALRSSELADAIDWERSRLSHHLGRMENRGAIVVLTADGLDAIRRASGPHLRAVKRLFADALEPEQIDNLAEALASIRKNLGSNNSTEGGHA
jgi:DNA-binding MarR family transcriptional regulator